MLEPLKDLKGEFTKKPEELSSTQLVKATKLAKALTHLRKFLYFFFSIGTAIAFATIAIEYADAWVSYIIIVLMIPYIFFKIRDFIRGTI